MICWVCGGDDPDVLLERDLPGGNLFIASVHAGCLLEANELSRDVAHVVDKVGWWEEE